MTTWKRILEAMDGGNRDEVLRLFRELPAAEQEPEDGDVSLVLHAVYRRHPELAAELARLREHRPDLLEAAALGWEDEARDRVEADAGTVRVRSGDGFTALHYAAYFGRADVASLLLTHGADPDSRAKNPSRVVPLHSAAAGGHTEVVRRLLEAGAQRDPVQAGGFTPLMAAALHGNRELVELLLDAGADPGCRADDGRSPADMAREEGHEELAERLVRGSSTPPE